MTYLGNGNKAKLQSYLRDKYSGVPVGLLLALGPSALEFALGLREGHWLNLPIVFASTDDETVNKIVAQEIRNVTGKRLRLSLIKSAEIARALVPNPKYLVLVGDPLEHQPFRRHFIGELPQAAAGLSLIDLTGLSLNEVRNRVAKLPEGAVIVYTAVTDDGEGMAYLPQEAVQLVAEVANRPVVVDVDNRIGRGATGGPVVLPARVGEEAAELVLRVFNGEDVSQIPIGNSDALRPVFDWRQLQRWGISGAQLPPNSIIQFREPSAWERYRTQIVLVGLVVAFQTALIIGILYEDRRRRRAEARTLALAAEIMHLNRVATAGELAASIAHEIRQPLSAIVARGGAGLNWLKRATPDLEKVRTSLENIVEHGHRADEVLRNIRAMFKKEVTAQALVNVNWVVEEVVDLVVDKLNSNNIQLKQERINTQSPIVRGNRGQLQQVLLNLVMNAIEAMSTIQGRDRVLHLRTDIDRAGDVLIVVQDSGPGIAPEHVNEVFKSFFTTKPDGMGLGLSICKSIVEAHGGQLTAMPAEPVGTVFTVSLPSSGERH